MPHRARDRAGSVAAQALGIALLCNLVEAVVGPDGWAWTGLRGAAAAVLVVGLLVWLILFVAEQVSGRRGR